MLLDTRIKGNEEGQGKIQDLRRESGRLWNVGVYVVPVVVGALGMVTDNLAMFLDRIGVTVSIEVLQKAALLDLTWDCVNS